jgi:hypothetical protein
MPTLYEKADSGYPSRHDDFLGRFSSEFAEPPYRYRRRCPIPAVRRNIPCWSSSFSTAIGLAEPSGGCGEMPLGETQKDRRLLKVRIAQQYLDGAEVGASIEEMGGKSVPACCTSV